MKKLILGALLLSQSAAAMAQGENWTQIGWSNKASLYIDWSTAKIRPDGKRSAWFRFKKAEGGDLLELDRFDCQERTTATVSQIVHDARGNVTKSLTFKDYQLEWEPVAPGTFSQTMINTVCGNE